MRTKVGAGLAVGHARQLLLDALDGKDIPDEEAVIDAWWRRGTEWAQPGAVLSDEELGISEYHLGPGVSSSGLGSILDAVVLYHEYIREANTHTPAKVLGSAIHAAVLQPDAFDHSYRRVDVGGRLTQDDKEGIATLVGDRGMYLRQTAIDGGGYRKLYVAVDGDLEPAAAHHVTRGTVALDTSLLDEILRLRDACYAHPKLGRILEHATTECEQSYYGTDPETGILCRARADVVTATGFVLDFKTASDASWEAFRGATFRYGYDVQAAFYPRVIEWCTGRAPQAFAWVVFDKRLIRPEMIALHVPDQQLLDEGWRKARTALGTLNGWIERALQDGIASAWAGYGLDFDVITRYRQDREDAA